MSKEVKKGFLLYADYREHLEFLSDTERGQLLMALFEYHDRLSKGGHEAADSYKPELFGACFMAFSFIKKQMERDDEKYEKKISARREAGKKGGETRVLNEIAAAKNPYDAKENDEEAVVMSSKVKQSQAKSSKAKQSQAKSSKVKQSQANQANTNTDTDTETETETDTETDTDTETITVPVIASASSCEEEKAEAAGAVAGAQGGCAYKDVMRLYHSLCPSLAPIRDIFGKRGEAVDAFYSSHDGRLDAFAELFTAAESSLFLRGGGERGWRADFDWLIEPENAVRVLEGRYADSGGVFDIVKGGSEGGKDRGLSARDRYGGSEGGKGSDGGTFETDEFFEAALRCAERKIGDVACGK